MSVIYILWLAVQPLGGRLTLRFSGAFSPAAAEVALALAELVIDAIVVEEVVEDILAGSV